MREIALDTETTGFDPLTGDRIVEIGCVELINSVPTDNTFHVYINPERDVPEETVKVHGLTNEFLADKPIFSEIISDFQDFIKDDALVIHNAEFDMKFLNSEFHKLGFKNIKNKIVDTLIIARQKFPGSPANLDALCRRFNIDNSSRTTHGALLDAQLLSEVYLELCGGRQPELLKEAKKEDISLNVINEKVFREDRNFEVNSEELIKHQEMLSEIKDSIWE